MTHYLSSAGLTQCTTCRRHVHAASKPKNTTCPFCRTKSGGVKGGVLAVALFGLAACGGSPQQPAEAPPAEQPVSSSDPAPAEPPDTQAAPDDGYDPAEDDMAQPEYGLAMPMDDE